MECLTSMPNIRESKLPSVLTVLLSRVISIPELLLGW